MALKTDNDKLELDSHFFIPYRGSSHGNGPEGKFSGALSGPIPAGIFDGRQMGSMTASQIVVV